MNLQDVVFPIWCILFGLLIMYGAAGIAVLALLVLSVLRGWKRKGEKDV